MLRQNHEAARGCGSGHNKGCLTDSRRECHNIRQHAPGFGRVAPQWQEDRRKRRYSEPAAQPGGYPAVDDEGGDRSCDLLAVGKRRPLRVSRCCKGCRQDQGIPAPAGNDVANLEAKKAQGVVGCPDQVGGDVAFEDIVCVVSFWCWRSVKCGDRLMHGAFVSMALLTTLVLIKGPFLLINVCRIYQHYTHMSAVGDRIYAHPACKQALSPPPAPRRRFLSSSFVGPTPVRACTALCLNNSPWHLANGAWALLQLLLPRSLLRLLLIALPFLPRQTQLQLAVSSQCVCVPYVASARVRAYALYVFVVS